MNFIENLKYVFLQLKLMKSTSFIIQSISKICFDNFLELNEIKLAIEFLVLSFCDDGNYDENKNINIEKVFHYILINGIKDSLFEILNLPDKIFYIFPNLEYLQKLVLFFSFLKVVNFISFN